MRLVVTILTITSLIDIGVVWARRNRVLWIIDSGVKTTWNDANVLCGNLGMRLLNMNTEDVLTAMKIFVGSKQPWEGKLHDFWIGLHDYSDVSGVTDYVWSSCKPLRGYTAWRNQDKVETERCVRGKADLKKGDNWETRDCSKSDGSLICEQFQGSCTFDGVYKDVKTSSTGTSAVSTTFKEGKSLEDCKLACLNHVTPKECWGTRYTDQYGGCTLYLANSYTQFVDSLTDGTGRTYVKFCFTADIDYNTLPTPVYNEPERDKAPHTGCSAPATDPPIDTTTTPPKTTTTISETTILELTTTTTTPSSDVSSPETTTNEYERSEKTKTTTPAVDETSTTMNSESTATTFETTAQTTRKITANTDTTSVVTTGSNTEEKTSQAVETVSLTTDSEVFETTRIDTNPPTSGVRTAFIVISTDAQSALAIQTTAESSFSEAVSVVCDCECTDYPSLTEAEKLVFIANIITNLTIDTSQLSAQRRRYISVEDPRPSAKAVGGAGMVLFAVVFVGIFLLDFKRLITDFKFLMQTVLRFFRGGEADDGL